MWVGKGSVAELLGGGEWSDNFLGGGLWGSSRLLILLIVFFFFLFFFFFFCLFRAVPATYGSSQARGPIRYEPPPMPQSQQCQIQDTSATYTTAHGNARSLTHYERLGIKLEFSWILVGFVNC